MKKIFFVLLILLFLTGCQGKNNKEIDYSNYLFTDVNWTRDSGQDIETIRFNADGSFRYYCACGNSVNDSDLCESYRYNDETKEIKLECFEITKEMITTIKLIEVSEDILKLDFNGDIRIFTKENKDLKKDTITYNGKNYTVIEYRADIFTYDLAISGNYEEDIIYPIKNDKWDIVYSNGDLYGLTENIHEINSYYKDDKNYTWHASVESVKLDFLYKVDLNLTETDLEYIYNMENMEKNETIFFEEIEKFAILSKTSKDGLIIGTTELAWNNDSWYWRSEIIDEKTEGWPEYIYKLPESLINQINQN